MTFYFKRHVYSGSRSKVDPLVAQTSSHNNPAGGCRWTDSCPPWDKRERLPFRRRGLFFFVQSYRGGGGSPPLFGRSSLFWPSNEQIKARSSMGGISTRRWLPRGARARFLLHPPEPTTLAPRDPVISFLFHGAMNPAYMSATIIS